MVLSGGISSVTRYDKDQLGSSWPYYHIFAPLDLLCIWIGPSVFIDRRQWVRSCGPDWKELTWKLKSSPHNASAHVHRAGDNWELPSISFDPL